MSLSPRHVGGGTGDGPLANEGGGGVNEGGETPVLVSDSNLKIKADIASKLCTPLSASASKRQNEFFKVVICRSETTSE